MMVNWMAGQMLIGEATCSTSCHRVLEAALSKAATGQSLSPKEAGALSGALFDAKIAGILLRALQTQEDSQSSSYIPSGDSRSLGNSSIVTQQEAVRGQPVVVTPQPAAKPIAGHSTAAQVPRRFVQPQPWNHDVPQTTGGRIDGVDIAIENTKTRTFNGFMINDQSGNEIPQARKILETLKLFCAPTEEVPEENRGSKLLYLYGEPGTGKTTAAVIAMRKLEKRGHKVFYVASEEIEGFSFDLTQLPHSVFVIDDLNHYPYIDTLEKKLRAFILAAYNKPSVRIIITSNNTLEMLQAYLVTDPYSDARVTNADQIQSRFETMCIRAAAEAGLCFNGLPLRRK